MYGRAMSCDVCGKIKMIDIASDVYLVDAAANGWIVLHINQPLVDNWTYKGIYQSHRTASIDCCTIDCAQKYLRESAEDSSPIESDHK